MGKENARPVIDLDFSGLTMPQAVFNIGREDIKVDRPGDVLIEKVREARADGVFAALQAERDNIRQMEEQADAIIGKRALDQKATPAVFDQGKSPEIPGDNRD